MLSKDSFCKALHMIQKQEETDSKFSDALNLVGDGHFIFGVKNQYYAALLIVLREVMDDKYEYIDWWLNEAPGAGYTVWWDEDGQEVSVDLTEPGALYDFLVKFASQDTNEE